MTIQDYLQRLKQWRQQLCVDRLILLVLVLSNVLLLIHCLNRKPAVELSLPFMDRQIGIQSGEASQIYYEWWGLSLAELLGNLNPQNLSFLEARLQSLLSPNLYQQVHETLNQQFQQLREDQVSLSFEPSQIEFDETIREVRVTGNSALSSGHQRLSGQKTFTFQFNLIRYRPVLAAIQIESDLK
ncbi:TraE/TraK family type IV conjugative transfer system protein [Endozoicomonas lisbonensis]|uniref:Conjugal transfer pilus assembly protein TraE n=1 Tax=Endozoicomonas lisbonensis TaxID=3120522 RepID=A0ABV2SNG7_9GAMM